ncbi:MAG TPA: hypothetical protein VM345_01820 [Acidimicrobiales bacterium]|nr:hypothetical protein [Acidimicrobiales bacterium]
MTRRREVPTLAFTIREAAEALRLDDKTLRSWVNTGIVRTVTWNRTAFVPRVELDRIIDEGMAGTFPPPAVAAPAPSSAEGADSTAGAVTGAGGPRERHAGEVVALGRSGEAGVPVRRPPAPTTKQPRRAATRQGRDSAAL